METLKETLDKLEDKVNAVKQQLQLPVSMNKHNKPLVHYEELEDERYNDKEQQTITATDSSITLKRSDKKLAALITNIPKPKNFKPTYTNPYSPRRNSTYYVS